ncbi:nitrophenyl compound nitroreductase subunit ArsF family protein [Culturomica massiliensis]|uniref:nitrophenyl compound nitroreductase subunit ArsF family protein n=1 Tax=Culturomica massiliensis TaxID=1841857 RepID=UPI003AB2B8BE
MKRLLLFFFFALFSPLCIANGQAPVKVLYFHGQMRCKTCMAIESQTKKLLNEDFAKELKDGRITFERIDISKSENEKIADKYRIAYSSLLIEKGEVAGEDVLNLTKFAFANARVNPQFFRERLAGIIRKALKREIE